MNISGKEKAELRAGSSRSASAKKPSGELKYFSEADFLIVLGADNCAGLNRYQMTALVYHELKHAAYDREKEKFEVVSHDFEGFGREVEIFGDWKSDVQAMRRAFDRSAQPGLFEQSAAAK